jgi:hypothetical protein
MRDADDRRHVMLAVRFESDIAQNDEFIVAIDFFFGVSRRPSRSGLSPAQRRSVSTACSACSLLGRPGGGIMLDLLAIDVLFLSFNISLILH